MAKFLTGNALNAELEKLFEDASKQIILISPYIKLHDRYSSALRTKQNSPEIEVVVVFGKNADDPSRSMKQEDFNFFKEFPNVEIRYEKRLHAKYYANESSAILTSMNLYKFSQDNNIEAGVMTKGTLFGSLANRIIPNAAGDEKFDDSAWAYFSRVIEQSDLLFKKVPDYESTMLGLSKKYRTSIVEVDRISDFLGQSQNSEFGSQKEGYEKSSRPNGYSSSGRQIPDGNIISTVVKGKNISTSALSRELGVSSKELFTRLANQKWIEKRNESWVLTHLGISKGGQTMNGQYGEYIIWPATIIEVLR
jgi:hypothetical protein